MTLPTVDEMVDSLTGFDEMAIKQHFGATLSGLVEDQSTAARALVFVLKRHEGVNDDDARNAVLGMTLSEVMAHFGEPSVESGKGEQASEPQLETSPPSVP